MTEPCGGRRILVCRLLRFESIYTRLLLDRGVLVGGRVEELVMGPTVHQDAPARRTGYDAIASDEPENRS